MKKLFAIFMLAALPMTGQGAGGDGHPLQAANIDVGNHAAIQRGAKMFVNYCMGCHSAKYVRYKQLTEVGLSACPGDGMAEVKEVVHYVCSNPGGHGGFRSSRNL